MSDEPVSRGVCDANIKRVLDRIDQYHDELRDIKTVVHGVSGRNGLVKSVQRNEDAIARSKMVSTVIVGVVSSVIGSVVTAGMIYFLIP